MGKSDVYVSVAAARHGFKMVLRPAAAATRRCTMVLFIVVKNIDVRIKNIKKTCFISDNKKT